MEVQRWKDIFKESKKTIDALRDEVAQVKFAVEKSEVKQHKMRKEMDRVSLK